MIDQYQYTLALWRQFHDLADADAELASAQGISSDRRDWLRFARKSLLFSLAHAAERAGLARSTLIRLEERESSGSITLANLRKAAEALDCELVYVIRPRGQKSFTEASWSRIAPAVEAKAGRRRTAPQAKARMKLAIARELLSDKLALERAQISRQR